MGERLRHFSLLMSALFITACSDSKKPVVDFSDITAYQNFLKERADIKPLDAFNAEPLQVSAVGKVRAQPDIAIITATINAEHKNESQAVDDMSKIINAVQDSLNGQEIEAGFTAINSQREFDQECLDGNQDANKRHSEIGTDYWFNKNLDQRGDIKTKRRTDKARIEQKACLAQTIKVSTKMVIRIKPADAAGEALKSLADAGAEKSHLFGYGFTDYDAHYQKAADNAVKLARRKAEIIARRSGTQLGDIETFTIGRPEQTGRFGPQPHIIRAANRYNGQSGSVVSRQTYKPSQQGRNIKQGSQRYGSGQNNPRLPPATTFTCWNGSVVNYLHQCRPLPVSGTKPSSPIGNVVIAGSPPQTVGQFTVFNGVSNQVVQSTETVVNETGEILCRVLVPAKYKTIRKQVLVAPARTVEHQIPAVTKEIIVKHANSDGSFTDKTETIVVREAYIDVKVIPAKYETRSERVLVEPAREEWKPSSTAINANAFAAFQKKPQPSFDKSNKAQSPTTTNALTMSLLSGTQIISVSANLSYDYETPLDNKIIVASAR